MHFILVIFIALVILSLVIDLFKKIIPFIFAIWLIILLMRYWQW
jgi:hypothetical protein